MARVRLLTDVPEGRSGVVTVVTARRAQELVDRGQAERVVVREREIERT